VFVERDSETTTTKQAVVVVVVAAARTADLPPFSSSPY
jgi:hypothetical protein